MKTDAILNYSMKDITDQEISIEKYSSSRIYNANAPEIPEFNIPYLNKDFNVPLLQASLAFLGLTDFTAFRADGAQLEGSILTVF